MTGISYEQAQVGTADADCHCLIAGRSRAFVDLRSRSREEGGGEPSPVSDKHSLIAITCGLQLHSLVFAFCHLYVMAIVCPSQL